MKFCPRALAEAIFARADKRTPKERAAEYAGLLSPGSMIYDDLDGPVIKDFRFELVQALHDRGLETEPVTGGHIVVERYVSPPVEAPVASPRVRAATCMICGQPWFDCEHGTGNAVVIRW